MVREKETKNWIHIGSEDAGPWVAAIVSIVETCRRLRTTIWLVRWVRRIRPSEGGFKMNWQSHWQFVGSVPENYERYLVPSIFRPWAEDLVEIAAMRPCTV